MSPEKRPSASRKELQKISLEKHIEDLKSELDSILEDSEWAQVTKAGFLDDKPQTPNGLWYFYERSGYGDTHLSIHIPNSGTLWFKTDEFDNRIVNLSLNVVQQIELKLATNKNPSRNFRNAPSIHYSGGIPLKENAFYRDLKAVKPAKVFLSQLRDILTNPIIETRLIGNSRLPEKYKFRVG